MRFKNAVKVLIISVICTSCVNNFDKILQQEAAQYTANNCPQEAEPGTQLDSLVYNPQERIYTMYYSVSGANEVIMREQTPLLHHLLCQRLIDNADYKEIKDHGVTFAYVYRSKQTGATFYQTEIRSNEYAGLH